MSYRVEYNEERMGLICRPRGRPRGRSRPVEIWIRFDLSAVGRISSTLHSLTGLKHPVATDVIDRARALAQLISAGEWWYAKTGDYVLPISRLMP